jgi:hypothetical protein
MLPIAVHRGSAPAPARPPHFPRATRLALGLIFAAFGAAAAGADVVARRETDVGFALDAEFQRDGGVQYFYQLLKQDLPPSRSAVFKTYEPFDLRGRNASSAEPLHLVVGRVSYVLEKDISFFSEQRVRDPEYIAAVARGYGITRQPDGTFRASKMPANSFRIHYLDQAEVARRASDGGVARLLDFMPDAGHPAVVVVQENYDFSRVMGVRTGDDSYTWTAHYPLGPGRTQLNVCTMSYLHTVPPFFLGGEGRVLSESIDGITAFIKNLRAYQPPGINAPRR